MTARLPYKTTFDPEQVIQPVFTGGCVSLDNGARILVTTLGEDAILTNLATGSQFARIEGVRLPLPPPLPLAGDEHIVLTVHLHAGR